ncbi:MAG: hypothetical protein HYX71_03570 [Opitutae bacterium]|nr:hypothetical protein [Opitutae bacterium]
MNNVEAKFILQAYRPDGTDAGDATFAAALEQSRLDPGLEQWFARSQAFDTAISAKLALVQAPAGLREAILAGGRVTTPDTTRQSWWRQPAFAAVASVAVLIAASVAFWPKPAAASAALHDFALADALRSETHGGHGEDTGALQAALNEPTTRLGRSLPVNFAALRQAGCRTVSFNGHEVLEVCFKRDGVWFHCYIAQRADFPTLVAAVAPALTDRNNISLATWGDASLLYVVVSKTGRATLEKLL